MDFSGGMRCKAEQLVTFGEDLGQTVELLIDIANKKCDGLFNKPKKVFFFYPASWAMSLFVEAPLSI